MASGQAAYQLEQDRFLSVVTPRAAERGGLEDSSAEQIIERAAEAAREMLGMDMAYVADTRNGLQDYRALTGDAESFGAAVIGRWRSRAPTASGCSTAGSTTS